ncbi:Delta(8)-fatty-acid desaturase 2, partial [Cucurbita argyrosperma subsp. sororia]
MEAEKKYITSEELLKHNKPGDLWISIQGKVYNVTDWAKEHPGGDTPFLNLAGHDVTDAFIAYHPGTAWAYLDRLFTGFHLEDFHVSEVSKDYRRLASEFSRQGLFEKKGHVTMYSLISVAIMLFLVVYGVVKSESVLVHLGSAMILGMLWIQSAYVGHDSGHSTVMSSRGFNKLAQILSGNCLTGISIAWWKWTHNAHHISCNSLDHDPDLQHIPVFAVSTSFFKSLTSHFYARVNLFVQTLLLLFSTRKVPDRALNIMGILVFWTWFPLLVSYLPNWPERVMFVLASFAVTSLQHIQFCLNHFSANVYVGKPIGNDCFSLNIICFQGCPDAN